jgi:4-hydroxybenzoate polyprenyltransferase
MPTETSKDSPKTTDALQNHWIYRIAPKFSVPYLQLMRADRPIGTWLLLWPCLWSVALASHWMSCQPEAGDYILPNISLMILLAVGAFVMRGAGCVVNDLADKDFDAKVDRTKMRPLPSGRVSSKAAIIFLAFLCSIGLVVLLRLNDFTIKLALSSVILIIIYPFMKRITYWPQLILGFVFNWGALVGWAALTGGLEYQALMLYTGGIFWTLGYDTIYAHQDKDDDALIGVKSTALMFGEKTKLWLIFFYSMAGACFLFSGYFSGLKMSYFALMSLPFCHFIYQIRRLDINNGALCLKIFKSNHQFGILFFTAIILGHYI